MAIFFGFEKIKTSACIKHLYAVVPDTWCGHFSFSFFFYCSTCHRLSLESDGVFQIILRPSRLGDPSPFFFAFFVFERSYLCE